MSDRLFTLAQEIEAIRQCSQQILSETKSYDDSPHNNRLLALEQSLSVMEPDSHANAYGYGGMIDGGRHRATNRMGVRADDMFDSSGESGYTMPDNRRRGMPAPEYGWESEDTMPDNRRRGRSSAPNYGWEPGYRMPDNRRHGMPDSDYIQDSRNDIQAARDEIQAARDEIQNARADRRIGASAGARIQNFRNDEDEFIRPMRGDRRRGNNRSIGAIEI